MTWAWSLTTRLSADGDAGRAQVVDLFEEARRDRRRRRCRSPTRTLRLQDAGRQQRELVGLAAADDGVAGVGAAVVADDEVVVGR